MPFVVPSKPSRTLDVIAISLSGLCLAHCLLLPLAIVALPMLGFLSDAHWVHQVLIGLAFPVTLWAIGRSGHWRRMGVAGPVFVGLSLLAVAAFYEPLEIYEVPLSVTGALLLGFGHFRNARRAHSQCESLDS